MAGGGFSRRGQKKQTSVVTTAVPISGLKCNKVHGQGSKGSPGGCEIGEVGEKYCFYLCVSTMR